MVAFLKNKREQTIELYIMCSKILFCETSVKNVYLCGLVIGQLEL